MCNDNYENSSVHICLPHITKRHKKETVRSGTYSLARQPIKIRNGLFKCKESRRICQYFLGKFKESVCILVVSGLIQVVRNYSKKILDCQFQYISYSIYYWGGFWPTVCSHSFSPLPSATRSG